MTFYHTFQRPIFRTTHRRLPIALLLCGAALFLGGLVLHPALAAKRSPAARVAAPTHADTDVPVLTIHTAQAGVALSPDLYGVFFEEINHAGDGGLYAELVRNRDFPGKC